MPSAVDVLGPRASRADLGSQASVGLASPEEFTVSRIAVPRPLHPELARRAIPRRAGRDIMYGATPIEHTLRNRQRLQPSNSDPGLLRASKGSVSSCASLPKITLGGGGLLRGPGSPSRPSPRHGEPSEEGNAASSVSASPPPGRGPFGVDFMGEPWLGVLSGGSRVDLPFANLESSVQEVSCRFGSRGLVKDPDRLAHWYRDQQAELLHQAAERRRPPSPKQALLPWASEREDVLWNLTAMGKGGPADDAWMGRTIHLRSLAALYEHLHARAALRGPEGLAEALIWKLGPDEDALRLLEEEGTNKVGIISFAGAMSILGIDMQKVCGAAVSEVLMRVDPLRSGVGQLRDLLALGLKRRPAQMSKLPERGPLASVPDASATVLNGSSIGPGVAGSEDEIDQPREPPPPCNWHETAHLATNGVFDDVLAAREKWAAVARWMGTASLRQAAMRQDRISRGWHDRRGGGRPSKQAKSFFVTADGEEDPDMFAADEVPEVEESYGWPAGDEECAPRASPSQVLLESAVALREQERPLKEMFRAVASIKIPDGPLLMSRADLHMFFSDLELADPSRARSLSLQVIDRLFVEAAQLQHNFTNIATGLGFWSFKAVLNNLVAELGLGTNWRRLADLLLDHSAKPPIQGRGAPKSSMRK
eukprot:TRINITY_DN63310_c0_g1_i1.p1 TRINITY_DN63310_c0_g1~~TRINITY_DN63310_c0_g1_i1.p1  ORF type:complete len:696 (-),score=97.94 TRINITY_DN63310_c0_g1_i1:196-2148(-)